MCRRVCKINSCIREFNLCGIVLYFAIIIFIRYKYHCPAIEKYKIYMFFHLKF